MQVCNKLNSSSYLPGKKSKFDDFLYAFIHLMHLIVGKGNWVADYFKKQQRILEGCLGMLSSKHIANIWMLF